MQTLITCLFPNKLIACVLFRLWKARQHYNFIQFLFWTCQGQTPQLIGPESYKNGRDPLSCLGRVFNSRLDSFAFLQIKYMAYKQTLSPGLVLKTKVC